MIDEKLENSIKILYIDDNSFDRELVRDALEKEQTGFRITFAKTQSEFNEKIYDNEYDIVLSDFNIAGFEGLQVIDVVHQINPKLPVIIVTGTGSEEVAVLSLKKGAADYVIKSPEHIRRLYHTIRLVLENQKLEEDRLKAQEMIQKNEEKYRALFNSARDGIVLFNKKNGTIVDCNLEFEKLINCSKQQLIGMNISGLNMDRKSYRGQLHKYDLNDFRFREPTERYFIRTDNLKIPTECIGTEVIIDDYDYIQVIIRDITERKNAEEKLKAYSERLEEMVEDRTRELKDAQKMLLHQERMSTLGQLARGMAHEMRTPLGAIKNAAYFLDMVMEDQDEDVNEAIQILNKEVGTSVQIIDSLLEYAYPNEPVKRKVEISDILESVVGVLNIPENVRVVMDVDERHREIFIDPEQFQRILRNLIKNAYQAMPEGGEIIIKTHGLSKNKIGITIIDNGVGIDERNIEKIFEPLFTTRPKGIGLGLPLAEMYIKNNGGKITVSSKVGIGSEFSMIFSE
jgi:PAS domain S-box-containing protein